MPCVHAVGTVPVPGLGELVPGILAPGIPLPGPGVPVELPPAPAPGCAGGATPGPPSFSPLSTVPVQPVDRTALTIAIRQVLMALTSWVVVASAATDPELEILDDALEQ